MERLFGLSKKVLEQIIAAAKVAAPGSTLHPAATLMRAEPGTGIPFVFVDEWNEWLSGALLKKDAPPPRVTGPGTHSRARKKATA